MIVEFHKNFQKRYKKLHKAEKIKCDERIILFTKNPFHPILNNHALRGEYARFRSINITGDLRAIYEPISDKTAFFIIIDTHSNLF